MLERTKVFFDTDIGDDIDDALALVMLLKMNKCDIVGISTVYKNTLLRARLAKKILSLMSKEEIPVYAGKRKPMNGIVDVDCGFVQYTKDLESKEYMPLNDSRTDEGEMAVDALIAAARKFKSQLTILAIGPYTNIAEAIKKDYDAFKDVRIVLMGGCFYEQFIEYNVACDPEAADLIYKSGLNIHLIGGDVTWKVQLNDEQTKKILSIHSDDAIGYAAELVRMWKSKCWFNPVLHDPLAAYYVIDSSICKMEKEWIEVELHGSITRGLTVNRDHLLKYLENRLDKKRLLCAKEVNVNKFINEFMNLVFK